jgi:hypothetical protein
MRVFEFKIDYLKQDLNSLVVEDSKIMSQKDYNIMKYIFEDAYTLLEDQSSQLQQENVEEQELEMNRFKVELCHYVQTDGINVQISWVKTMQ